MTKINTKMGPSHGWLLKMADAEDSCRSVSVGGMATDLLGTQSAATPEATSPQGTIPRGIPAEGDQAVERCAEE
jgi:hypothetical protein